MRQCENFDLPITQKGLCMWNMHKCMALQQDMKSILIPKIFNLLWQLFNFKLSNAFNRQTVSDINFNSVFHSNLSPGPKFRYFVKNTEYTSNILYWPAIWCIKFLSSQNLMCTYNIMSWHLEQLQWSLDERLLLNLVLK